MLNEFSHVFAFLLLGIVFVAGGIVTNYFIRPRKPNELKLSTYECGEDPIGSSWLKFNIRFYVVALIFILFDVEIVFLFPWAVVYKQMGVLAFAEMLVFFSSADRRFCIRMGKRRSRLGAPETVCCEARRSDLAR